MSYMDEDDHEFGEGFSMLNQDELSALLRSVGQHAAPPQSGNQAALVARLTAFMSGEHRGGGGPGFTVVAELEAAGADAELGVWQASADRLGELQASLVRTLEECEQQHAAHKSRPRWPPHTLCCRRGA